MISRFSILGLIELTAVVALVLANDRIFFQGGHELLTYVPMIGGMTGVYLGVRRRSDDRFASIVMSAGIWSAVVTFVNGLAMCAIVAERFRIRLDHQFTWSSQWPGFLIIVLILTIAGTGFGMLLASAPAVLIAKWKRSYSP